MSKPANIGPNWLRSFSKQIDLTCNDPGVQPLLHTGIV